MTTTGTSGRGTVALLSEGNRLRCRATALRQPDVGVLTVACAVEATPLYGVDDAELVFVAREGPGERGYPLRRPAKSVAAVLDTTVPLWQAAEPPLFPGTWDLQIRLDGMQVPLLAPSYGNREWPQIMVPAKSGPYMMSLSVERGAMTLQVAQACPYVEVDRVEIEGATLGLDAHLVPEFDTGVGEGQVVVQSRDRKDVAVRLPAEVTAGRLRVAIDLQALPSDDREDWDLYLRLADARQLRLGTHLDDIRNKSAVFSFPKHHVDRGGRQLTVQPFYTVGNGLSIRVCSAKAPSHDAGVPAATQQRAPPSRPLGRAAKVLTGVILSLVEIVGRLRKPLQPPDAQRRKVYFVVFHAHAMGGIVRTVFNLASELVWDHGVEIISVIRRRDRGVFPLDPRVKLTFLHDEVALRKSPQRGLIHQLRQLLHRRTSWLVHEREFHFNKESLLLDLKLLRRLHRLEPGILVTTIPSVNIAAARFARRGVVTIGQEHVNFTGRRHLQRKMRDHYRKLDALAVLTRGDEEDYNALLSGSRTRVHRIPNGLPRKQWMRADLDSKQVIAAGRYSPQKGFDLLVDAYQEVAREHPDWQLRVYGKGARRGYLQRRARDLQLHNHVLFMGQTDQLDEELARSSIFVLSSRFEGFAMVVIEAMAVGLPVVSFDCPRGPSDIITDGVNGTLVPPGDVGALAEGILDLLENPEKRRSYSEAALQTARSYEIDAIGQVWRRTFDELCDPVSSDG